jgi:biotin carboxylase
VARVLFVAPQARDLAAIERLGLRERHTIELAGEDLDSGAPPDLDALATTWEGRLDGVVGTKDRSALVAAQLATRLGLPGPTPAALLACQLKDRSRELQRALVPAATPRAWALRDGPPPFPPPYFVKPVVGRLSLGARRVDSVEELARLEPPAYVAEYARLAGVPAEGFLVEELLDGDEVTVEGFVADGEVTVVGVTDSVKYPGTNSFQRFEYPSALPSERIEELREVVVRLLPGLGFDGGFFNVELAVPAAGRAQIVEVNGRIASQFAPLVEAVEGRSTYEALVAVAAGEAPAWEPRVPHGVAISTAVRVFEDGLVEAVPGPQPGVELLVEPGRRLSEQGVNDVESYRLAIVDTWAPTRPEAIALAEERAASLRAAVALR